METQTRGQASTGPNWHSLISITVLLAEEADIQRETELPKSHSWVTLGPEWEQNVLSTLFPPAAGPEASLPGAYNTPQSRQAQPHISRLQAEGLGGCFHQ